MATRGRSDAAKVATVKMRSAEYSSSNEERAPRSKVTRLNVAPLEDSQVVKVDCILKRYTIKVYRPCDSYDTSGKEGAT